MNDHDCNSLHYDGEFTVTFFIRSKASEELMSWFEKVFKRQHPKSFPAFQLSWESSPEESDRLEISSYDPSFPTSALISLFESFKSADDSFEGKEFEGPKLVS